jgi:uncharacterized protein (TIGR03067 family)
MKPHFFLSLATGLLLAADKSSPEAPKQPSPLEGTWSVVSMQYQGKKVANEVLANTRLEISADKIVTRRGNKVMKVVRYKLLPKQKEQPRRIDLRPIKGSKKGQVNHGICALDGDTLRICAPESNAKGHSELPKEFATKPDSDLILMVLKREKA